MNIFRWKMSAKWLFTFKHFKFPLLPLLTHSALVIHFHPIHPTYSTTVLHPSRMAIIYRWGREAKTYLTELLRILMPDRNVVYPDFLPQKVHSVWLQILRSYSLEKSWTFYTLLCWLWDDISKTSKLKISNTSVLKLLSYFRVRFSFDSSFWAKFVWNSSECVKAEGQVKVCLEMFTNQFPSNWKCLLFSCVQTVQTFLHSFPQFMKEAISSYEDTK